MNFGGGKRNSLWDYLDSGNIQLGKKEEEEERVNQIFSCEVHLFAVINSK